MCCRTGCGMMEAPPGPETDQVIQAIETRPDLADELVCECELVTRGELEYVLWRRYPAPCLHHCRCLAGERASASARAREHSGRIQSDAAGFQTHRWTHQKPPRNSPPIFTSARRGRPSSTRASRVRANWDLNYDPTASDVSGCSARGFGVSKMGI